MATVTTKSRAELVTQALSNLGVLQAGQTPADEDASAVDGHIDGVFSRLAAKGVVTLQDYDAIPIAWFNTLAELVADDAQSEFGGKSDPQKVLIAETDLRIMARVKPTRAPLQTDYF